MKMIKRFLLISLVFCLFLTGCAKKNNNQNISMKNKKQAVLIVAPTGFQDKEYKDTKDALLKKDINIKTASTSKTATGKLGKKLEVDLLLKDLNVADYEAIVFIGGPGAAVYQNNEPALQIIKKATNLNKVVGAVCIAPTILAKAGVLKDKKATVWSSVADKSAIELLKENGANFVDKAVVVDGNLVTGNGPEAAYQFGLSLANKIK